MNIKQTAIALRDGYVSRQVRQAKFPNFPSSPIRRVRLTFWGRVQKVGFRQEVSELAARLGLTGLCQNLPDGSVLAEVQGPSNRIEFLIHFMGSLKRIQVRELHRQSLPLLSSEEGFVQQ
jgi:acylphosphatase